MITMALSLSQENDSNEVLTMSHVFYTGSHKAIDVVS